MHGSGASEQIPWYFRMNFPTIMGRSDDLKISWNDHINIFGFLTLIINISVHITLFFLKTITKFFNLTLRHML